MATVISITAERAEEIHDASITGAFMSGNNLILRTRGGSEINVGAIKANALDAWPVGSIFINTTSTSPATLLGGGTWSRFGQGKVLVSQDSDQTEFDTAEETGGEKTHLLTGAESGVKLTNVVMQLTSGPGYYNIGSDGDPTHRSTESGGPQDASAAHNNLQPYIVVYMWKRTA